MLPLTSPQKQKLKQYFLVLLLCLLVVRIYSLNTEGYTKLKKLDSMEFDLDEMTGKHSVSSEIIWSPNGEMLAVGSHDSILIINVVQQKLIQVLNGKFRDFLAWTDGGYLIHSTNSSELVIRSVMNNFLPMFTIQCGSYFDLFEQYLVCLYPNSPDRYYSQIKLVDYKNNAVLFSEKYYGRSIDEFIIDKKQKKVLYQVSDHFSNFITEIGSDLHIMQFNTSLDLPTPHGYRPKTDEFYTYSPETRYFTYFDAKYLTKRYIDKVDQIEWGYLHLYNWSPLGTWIYRVYNNWSRFSESFYPHKFAYRTELQLFSNPSNLRYQTLEWIGDAIFDIKFDNQEHHLAILSSSSKLTIVEIVKEKKFGRSSNGFSLHCDKSIYFLLFILGVLTYPTNLYYLIDLCYIIKDLWYILSIRSDDEHINY